MDRIAVRAKMAIHSDFPIYFAKLRNELAVFLYWEKVTGFLSVENDCGAGLLISGLLL